MNGIRLVYLNAIGLQYLSQNMAQLGGPSMGYIINDFNNCLS